MKCVVFLSWAAAVVAIAGTGSVHAEAAAVPSPRLAHTASAKARDWTQVVSATPAGGFVMGNPNARVKLIEYGSMTCPHCQKFDETGVPHLIADYVKTGEVSWEFRNYVRDAFDVTASLVARCNGPRSFFPLTRALYRDQEEWVTKVAQTPAEKLEPLHALPPTREFVALANVAGFQQWGAKRGLPATKNDRCLSDMRSIDQLVAMAGDAMKQFPDFQGTPSFVINGKLVDLGPITEEQVWPTLEAKIGTALSNKG